MLFGLLGSIELSVTELLATCPEDLRPMVQDLITSEQFERLKRISFLGAIERFGGANRFAPSAGSRYDHSIGVARIALRFASISKMSPGELRIAIAHALLHDIGHGPFSHSSEAFFRARFEWDHHKQLLATIIDRSTTLSKVLQRHGIWFDYCNFLHAPKKFAAVDAIYNGPINADTIEGILRVSRFFGARAPIDEQSLMNAFGRKSLALRPLDNFWTLKDSIYNHHIFSEQEAQYDKLLCDALFSVSDEVNKADFLLDDDCFEERYCRPIQFCLSRLSVVSTKPDVRKRDFQIRLQERPTRMAALRARYVELKQSHETKR